MAGRLAVCQQVNRSLAYWLMRKGSGLGSPRLPKCSGELSV